MSITIGFLAKMLQKNGRATANTLVKLTGKPIKSVLSTLKTLHDRSKIYIAAYEINKQGQASRVWMWGDGDDAREPITGSRKQVFIPRPDVAAAWLYTSL
jgi:hypothetical protein